MKRLFVSVNSLDTVKKLDKNLVQGVIVNSQDFSSGLSANSLEKITELAHHSGFIVIVRLDCLYSEDLTDDLRVYLRYIEEAGVYGVLCTDLAVKVLTDEEKLSLKVIYAPETLLTNCYDVEEMREEGFDHCVISKDIPLADVYDILNRVQNYCWLRIHGPILLSYSARHYVSSYLERNCRNELFELQESTRNDRLVMIEKEAGSWLYGTCLESFGEVENLMHSPVDALVIDNTYMSDEYTLRSLELYQDVLSGNKTAEEAIALLRVFDPNVNYSSLSEIKKTVLDKEKK